MTAAVPRKRFGISDWRLGWKVVAVIAVPLILMLVFGGLQIWSQLDRSRQLAAASAAAAAIPATADLDAAAEAVAAAQASGTFADTEFDELGRQIGNAQTLLDGGALTADSAAALRVVVDRAKQIQAAGRTPASSLTSLADTVRDLQSQAVRAVQAAIPDEPAAATPGRTVTDALALRQSSFATTIATLELSRDPRLSPDPALVAIGGERALLAKLAGDLPAGDPVIADLTRGVDERAQLIDQGASSRSYSVSDLADSARAGVALSSRVVNDATRQITTDVDDRAVAARRGLIVAAGLLSVGLLLAVLLAVVFARAMTRPLRRLRDAARNLAEHELPAAIDRIKVGENAENITREPMPIDTGDDVGGVARAVDDIHDQTLRLAGEQARRFHERLRRRLPGLEALPEWRTSQLELL